MKTYFYYSRTDKTKEVIAKTTAENVRIAMEFFAKLKVLSLSKFMAIYDVESEEED